MLLLLDRDETFIASLPYNNPLRKRELNGLNTFEVETSKEVEDGQRLVFKDSLGKWNEYIIYDHFKTHDKDGVTYEVYAEDSTSELYGTYIDDLKPRKAKATAILGKILENTRFEVGKVDDFGVQSFNLYHTNAKKALWTILEKYGAEIQVRIEVQDNKIIHRYIDLKKRIGFDTGKRFTYKKDTQGVKKTTSTKNLVTKIYVYGKGEEVVDENGHSTGGYGRKINFAEINGGKKYLEDEEARLLYGYGKERKHIEDTVEFSDCEDKKELLELGKKALKEKSKPEISYELKVEDISRYDGYIGEGVGLGDTVLVIDKEIDVRVQTRVVSITDNPLEEIKDSEIVLGNFIKDLASQQTEYEKLKNQLESRNQGLYDELQKLAEGVEGSYIDSVVERFNEELNSTGGWVYAEKGEGIIILNAPKESGNATQSIKLAGGIIGIANSKRPDGTFDYRTFGDGNGFTADLITAGILKGGKVHWNLEDGTFLIGKSTKDYSLWWDGVTLHMRNADLDLENNDTIKGMKSQITQTSEKIEHEVTSIESNITSMKSQIRQTSSEVSSKVSKNGIISSINQTSESIKIRASKIDLTGNLSLKGDFTTKGSSYWNGRYRPTRTEVRDGSIHFYNDSSGRHEGEIMGVDGLHITGDDITIGSGANLIMVRNQEVTIQSNDVRINNGTLRVTSGIDLGNTGDIRLGRWRMNILNGGDDLEISYGSSRIWGLYIDSSGVYRISSNTLYKLADA